METDPAHILSLPDDERDLAIRKLIVKGPWKHDWKTCILTWCRKCQGSMIDIDRDSSCPIPDPIALDWNLAKAKQAGYDDKIFEEALFQIWKTTVDKGNYYLWHLCTAQPHHYILAAVIAGEGT